MTSNKINSIELQVLNYIAINTTEKRLVTLQQIKLGLPHVNCNSIPNNLQRLLEYRFIFALPKDERSYGYAATVKGIEALAEVEANRIEEIETTKNKLLKLLQRN